MRRADHYGPSLRQDLRTWSGGAHVRCDAAVRGRARVVGRRSRPGLGLGLFEVAAAYLAGAALASAVPTPSGLDATEAALAASLVAVGATIGPAVAAVLAFRLVTVWLPILPGALALHWLRSRQSL